MLSKLRNVSRDVAQVFTFPPCRNSGPIGNIPSPFYNRWASTRHKWRGDGLTKLNTDGYGFDSLTEMYK